MEQGRRLSIRNLRAIAIALDVSADYLLGLTDDPSCTAGRTHTCCQLVAEADAWLRTHLHYDDEPQSSRERWLPFWARLSGSLRKILPHDAGPNRVELIECGVYSFDGQVFRRGNGIPEAPPLEPPPDTTRIRERSSLEDPDAD
jgi:hypothetical protein